MAKNNPIIIHIGKRVAELRKAQGITQEILADYIGIARPALTMIERGTNGTPAINIYKICCALNCKPNDLFPVIKPVKRVTKTVQIRKTILVNVQKVKKLK